MVHCVRVVRACCRTSRRRRTLSHARKQPRSPGRRGGRSFWLRSSRPENSDLLEILLLRLRNQHRNQHLQIVRSSLVPEEHTNRPVHLSRKTASQILHNHSRNDQSIYFNPLLRLKNLPNNNRDLSPRVARSDIRSLPIQLRRHVLEHVGHGN